jgi:hypothetical protein
MKSIHLLLLYIGDLPIYINQFLRSCEANPTIQWTLLTTNNIKTLLPQNVQWYKLDIKDFKQRVKRILEIDINNIHYYKICDFRPAYGLLYKDIFRDCDFWGYCDADIIFGDLREFFPDSVLHNQVKVQMRGGFSLYSNDNTGISLFQLPHPYINYRNVFTNPKNCYFDEWKGINKILKYNKINYYITYQIAEISYMRKDITLIGRENYSRQIFTWENGKILRTAWENEKIIQDEYAYIHLQKRPIYSVPVNNDTNFAFLPREIVSFDNDKQKFELSKLNQRSRLWEFSNQLGRIPRYFKSSKTIDRKVLRQKK